MSKTSFNYSVCPSEVQERPTIGKSIVRSIDTLCDMKIRLRSDNFILRAIDENRDDLEQGDQSFILDRIETSLSDSIKDIEYICDLLDEVLKNCKRYAK